MEIDFDRLKYGLTGEYEEIKLEKQVNDLQQKINKAIEYIEENCSADNRLNLKLILKGDDTNE